MIGQTVSHYRILEELGGGGMGVVYKAQDLRLNRFVALKFLSADLIRDLDANQRFRQEAQSASALDHPNICTIHEIDETPSGDLFLTMAYYEGETLRSRIARGPLDVPAAVDIALQAAQGLARAHQSGLIHRDIKPANLIVCRDGVVKIVDFGLAKLTGHQDVTRTGTILGTVAYMSPEQARGDALDARTDVWSLGVVLFEMLTGQRPFMGRDDVAVLSGILSGEPSSIRKLRPDIPDRLRQIVDRALDRPLPARYPSATEMAADLANYRASLDAAVQPAPRSRWKKPVVAAVVAAAIMAVSIPVALSLRRTSRERWVRNVAVPEIRRLVEADDSMAAFALAKEVERISPSELTGLWGQFSVAGTILTNPDGADVYVQPYAAPDERWEHLGRTPVKQVRLARAAYRIRIEKPGYETRLLAARNPGAHFNQNLARTDLKEFVIALLPAGSVAGMVPVTGGAFPVGLTGFNSEEAVAVPAFLIDRYEVTNKEFKAFVDGGGYAGERHWAGLPSTDGGTWRPAGRKAFVDATGRPGPATWELGAPPPGRGDHPVGGVSWYEAAAYCHAAGKSLPTIYHWARSALSPLEINSPLAPAVIPLSNFGRQGSAAVGAYRSLGPYGTYDMAGNVREWVWNETAGGRRWILGGASDDLDYLFTVPNSLPPDDRSATNGFRCVRYENPGAVGPRLLGKVESYSRNHRAAKAVSDEVYAVFLRQFAKVNAPLNAKVTAREENVKEWIRETLSFDAGYEPGQVTAHVLLPREGSPPYQVVVLFPGVGPFVGRAPTPPNTPFLQDFVMRSGRALVVPIYKGSFERWDPFLSLEGAEYLRSFRDRMFHWRQDLGRTLDALSDRKDLDLGKVAYFGSSFGASTAFPLVALEDRIKAAILAPAGFTYRELPPEADALNYLSRVTIPILMMGGRHDYIFPLETAQKPMFDRLATPAEHKRHVIVDSGHGLPRSQVIRESLDWLDRYLGPVTGAKPTK